MSMSLASGGRAEWILEQVQLEEVARQGDLRAQDRLPETPEEILDPVGAGVRGVQLDRPVGRVVAEE